jgi:cytochrome P450
MSSRDIARDALTIWNAKDRDNPVPAFAALRALGAVHRVVLDDGVEAWCIVRHDEAKAALGDARLSKDMHAALSSSGNVVSEGLPGPAFARHMLAVDPPDHTRLRRLVANAFTNTRVDALRTRVQHIANELLDNLLEVDTSARPVDLVAAYALPLPFTVICELLGVAIPDREAFGRDLRVLLSPADTPAASERARHASDSVVAFLGTLVAAKRTTPGDDLVSDLISARDGNDRSPSRSCSRPSFSSSSPGTTRRRACWETGSSRSSTGLPISRHSAPIRRGCRAPSKSSFASTRPSRIRRSATRPHRSTSEM